MLVVSLVNVFGVDKSVLSYQFDLHLQGTTGFYQQFIPTVLQAFY